MSEIRVGNQIYGLSFRHYDILIVDKLNMVKLDILLDIASQLAKAYSISHYSIVLFGDLPIEVSIDNFYLFLSIAKHFFGEI